MPPAIPDRWTAYKPCGTVIEGTKLICFKVPLKKTVQMGKVDKDGIWDIPTLLKRIPNLGAVIDLTNTCRYYSPQDLISAGVLHRKILIPGRMIPPEHKVIEFMDTVDDFLGRIGDQVIGVHCTHGLNRTGYMVGRFMRDRMQIPPKVVIKRFERARGYQIERENYVADILGCPEVPPPQLGPHTQVKPIDSGGEHSVKHRGYDSDSRRKRRYSHNDHNGSLKMSSTSGSSHNKNSYSKRRCNWERPNLHLDKTERLRSTSDLNPRNDGPA